MSALASNEMVVLFIKHNKNEKNLNNLRQKEQKEYTNTNGQDRRALLLMGPLLDTLKLNFKNIH